MSYAVGFNTRRAKRDWKRICGLCQGAVIAGDAVTTYIVRDGGDFSAAVEHAICRGVAESYHADHGYPHDDGWPMLVDFDVGDAIGTAMARLATARGQA